MRYATIGGDFTHELRGVRDAATGSYLNSATITYTIRLAEDDSAVAGGTGSLSYVAASDGIYRGVTESTVTATLTAHAIYYAEYPVQQSSYDEPFREYFIAKPPGGGIIDATRWAAWTQNSLSATDEIAAEQICSAVAEALTRRCYPNVLEPTTITLFPFDAPCNSRSLFLPRPIRSITAIYYHSGAGGDSSVLDLTADLLVAGTDYYSKPTDVMTRWNRTGIVTRLNRSNWGGQFVRATGRLASTLEDEPGSIFVSAKVGPVVVSPAVQEAAKCAVSLLFERRAKGVALQSESWAGYSASYAGPFTAEAAVNSPDMTGFLRAAGVLPMHVG